jgi:hypothetical protein
MRTACRTEGEQAYFIVYDLDPLAYEGAQHLGFVPYEDGLARMYPASTPHLDTFYQHFARISEEMIQQRTGSHRVPWEQALEALLQRLEGQDIDTIHWRGYALRVPPLAIQLEVNERRGLEKRVQEIRHRIQLIG